MSDIPTFLEIQRISKHFGKQVALRQIDFQVQPSESIALLGANGAGKSSLLRILATLSRPSRGVYRAFASDAWGARIEVRKRLGVVGHQPFIYPELTVRENLQFFASMYSLQDHRSRIDIMLEYVGLTERRLQRAETLSRGLLQRLDLARSMLHRPSVLVFDEPDTGLDTPGRQILSHLMTEQRELGGSVIFSSHALDFAIANAGRIVVLSSGSITLDAATKTTTTADIEFAMSGGSQIEVSA